MYPALVIYHMLQLIAEGLDDGAVRIAMKNGSHSAVTMNKKTMRISHRIGRSNRSNHTPPGAPAAREHVSCSRSSSSVYFICSGEGERPPRTESLCFHSGSNGSFADVIYTLIRILHFHVRSAPHAIILPP